MKKIKNPNLLKNQFFINNKWGNSFSNKKFPVYNPLDQSLIDQISDCGEQETKDAIQAANDAFVLWKSHTANERSNIIKIAHIWQYY